MKSPTATTELAALKELMTRIESASLGFCENVRNLQKEREQAGLEGVLAEGYSALVREDREFARATGELQRALEASQAEVVAQEAVWAAEDAANASTESERPAQE